MTRWDTHPTPPAQAEQSLIQLGHWIDSRDWCPATGGNFSHRLAEDEVMITRSGCHKGNLAPTDFLKVSLSGQIKTGKDTESGTGTRTDTLSPPNAKPSAETLLHTTIFQNDPQAQVVLHTHSVNSTVLSRLTPGDWLSISGFEMQKALAGNTTHAETIRIAIVDNQQDMVQLASTLTERWRQTPLSWGFLVRGHGLYSWGDTAETARRHLEGLEFLFACQLEMRRFNQEGGT